MYGLEVIVARAKRRGFVYPGSDIYGGLANARDYGPYGIQLKKNIQDLRWQTFVQERPDMIGLDSQILMHPKVWEASGHVDGFNDPLIDDKNTGERFRADKLIEDRIEEMRKLRTENGELNGDKFTEYRISVSVDDTGRDQFEYIDEVLNALISKAVSIGIPIRDPKVTIPGEFKFLTLENANYTDSFGPGIETLNSGINLKIGEIKSEEVSFEELSNRGSHVEFEAISLGILRDLRKKGYNVNNLVPESWTFEQMKAFIVAEVPNNPGKKKQKADRTDVRKFELMFSTHQGVIRDDENKIWMRPETAQGIFVNFKNVMDTTRMRVPFGIAQVGKAFRNEITPGNFLYRTREFEQMEIEYFVHPDAATDSFTQRQEDSMTRWKDTVGLKQENLRFREHESDELSHYSAGTFDVDYQYPRGWGELQGIANRTDYDLQAHQEMSGKDMQYTDPYSGERYIPYVIEPSFGLSRTVLAAMLDAYDEETYVDGNGKEQTRVVSRFPKQIAPVKFAILPLLKKDEGMVSKAKEMYAQLSKEFIVEYDDGGNIGKRYRRQDEIGTPYCITIDHETLEDGTVTIRHRDDMSQERVTVDQLANFMQ